MLPIMAGFPTIFIKQFAIGCLDLLSKLTGNRLSQRLLEYNVVVAQYLMGVGCGSSPESSGCNIDSRTFFQDFFYFFKKYGMSNITRITPTGYLAPIHRYQEVYEQFRTSNFLVFPDGELG